jgi:16S rRNA (guanine527-N7)-methyltransferase
MRTKADPRLESLPEQALERWLMALVETTGLTSIRNPEQARREHLIDSLEAVPLVARFGGPIADVGSGGGAPGIPLAAAFPNREVTLIESQARKCRFLERFCADFPNLRVVCGRAEEQKPDSFGVVVAKALAPPAVALEWCLALVEPGGAAILFTGVLESALGEVAQALGGGPPEVHPVGSSLKRRLVLVPKLEPTPPGFPRRPGIARKRPLG